VQLLLGLSVSVLALALSFYNVNLTEMAAAFRAANYWLALVAVGLIWGGLYFRALSWWTILEHQVPYRRVFDVINEGYLLNNFLPFRLGELGRAYLLSRSHRLPVTHALSSVVVERVVDLLMLLTLLGAFLPLLSGLAWARNGAIGALVVGLGLLGALLAMVYQRARVLRLAHIVLSRLHWRWAHPAAWEQRLMGFMEGLAVLRAPRLALWACVWSALAWLAAGLGAWALLLAFEPTATFTMGFFVLAVLGLGIAVPSAPGSAGVFEAAVMLALSVFDVDPSRALSYALAFHLTHLGVTSVLGGLALTREGETLGHLAQAAQDLLRAEKKAEPMA
jgi:hypothetical protein